MNGNILKNFEHFPIFTAWVKPPGYKCDMKYTEGVVGEIISDQLVPIAGLPRHITNIIRDIRPRELVKGTCEKVPEETWLVEEPWNVDFEHVNVRPVEE